MLELAAAAAAITIWEHPLIVGVVAVVTLMVAIVVVVVALKASMAVVSVLEIAAVMTSNMPKQHHVLIIPP